jgi:hypothetical protein
MALVQQSAAAVATLYSPGVDEGLRRRADEWLRELAPSRDAWDVALAFLSALPAAGDTAGEQRVFFGAHLFLTKLRNDFSQLPEASLGALKEQLLDAMRRCSTGGAATRVALRKLCIAYTDFLVQVPGLSPHAMVAELVDAFPPGGAPGGLVVLLEVLCALPEEAHALPGLGERRSQLFTELSTIGPAVLDLLRQLLERAGAGGDVPAMNTAFDALGAWLRYVRMAHEDVAAAPVVAHLVEAAVKHEALFSKASSALHELVEFFGRRRGTPENPAPPCPALAALIVASVGKLLPLWMSKRAAYDEAVARDDDAAVEDVLVVAEALSRLFADAAYAFLVPLLRHERGPASVPGPPGNWEAEVTQWVRLLCAPVDHPAMSVVEPTFRTWRKLAECHAQVGRSSGRALPAAGSAAAAAEAAHAARVDAVLAPPLLALVPAWVARLAFPPNAAWGGWTADRVESFKHDFRYDCADALLLAATVAGGEATLRALGATLQGELTKWEAAGPGAREPGADGWQGVEASLYAVRSVARCVPPTEAAVLPHIFQLLLARSLPLRVSPELRATAFRLIGRYAKWLSAQPPAVHAAAFSLLLQEGFAGPPASGVAPPPGGGAPPAVVLASAATDSAALAISKLVDAVGAPLHGEARALPSRVHLPGMHTLTASYVVDAFVAGSMPLLAGAGGGDAARGAVHAVAAPITERLLGLCGSGVCLGAGGALRACAADGTVAACLTSRDGVVRTSHLIALGLDVGGAAVLWEWAAAHGGSVADCTTVALRPERLMHGCVTGLLHKLTHLVNAFSGTIDGAYADRWAAFAPPGFAAAYRAMSRDEREAHKGLHAAANAAAEAATTGSVSALFALIWPALQAVLATWGSGVVPPLEPGAPSPPLPQELCLDLAGNVWDCLRPGLENVGAPLYPHAAVFCAYLAAAFAVPAIGAAPRLLAVTSRAVWLLGNGAGVSGAPPRPGAGELRAPLAGAVHAGLAAALARLTPEAGQLLGARENAGERVALSDCDVWVEALVLSTRALREMPFLLLEEAPAGFDRLLPRLLALAAAGLASCEPRVCAEASLFVQALAHAARPREGLAPARSAALGDALGEGRLVEVVRRLTHAALVPHLRELFATTNEENAADALRECARLLQASFAPALTASLTPPTAAFGPATAAKLSPHLVAAAVEKLVVAMAEGSKSKFGLTVMALHNAVVRGEMDQLLNPHLGAAQGDDDEEDGYVDEEGGFPYHYEEERER